MSARPVVADVVDVIRWHLEKGVCVQLWREVADACPGLESAVTELVKAGGYLGAAWVPREDIRPGEQGVFCILPSGGGNKSVALSLSDFGHESTVPPELPRSRQIADCLVAVASRRSGVLTITSEYLQRMEVTPQELQDALGIWCHMEEKCSSSGHTSYALRTAPGADHQTRTAPR